MLTSDKINKIALALTRGKPVTLKTDEEKKLAEELKMYYAENQPNGWEIDLPCDLEDK